jgi:hypothetical protein
MLKSKSECSSFSDLTRIQKTSSGKAREITKCAINRILIAGVRQYMGGQQNAFLELVHHLE